MVNDDDVQLCMGKNINQRKQNERKIFPEKKNTTQIVEEEKRTREREH